MHDLHVKSAFSICKSSFLPFGCNTFSVLPQLFDFLQFLGHHCWGRSATRMEFVQSIRASVGYLGAAGLEMDPNLQHSSMCHPGDRAKPRTKDRYTSSINQVWAKSKPEWDSWARGQGLGRGPGWGCQGHEGSFLFLGWRVRNQRMRLESDWRAQGFIKNFMCLGSKPRKNGKSYLVEIQNKKVGLELRGEVKIPE